jgi:hypothetical protein
MTCATAWLQAAFRSGDAVRRIVVVDEAWAVLSDLSTRKARDLGRGDVPAVAVPVALTSENAGKSWSGP